MWADILLILFGVVLTAGTALFVAAEFSLVALDPATVERRMNEGDKSVKPVLRALRQLSTQLSGSQVGITITTILLGYTTQSALALIFTDLGVSLGLALTLSTTAGIVISAILVNMFSMLFGELLPKNFALSDPLKTARVVARAQMLFTTVFKPLIFVLDGSANLILRRFGIEPTEELSSARSATELASMVRHSAEEGVLDPKTATLFTKSVGLGTLTAVDVMTHRSSMHVLRENQTAADLIDLAARTGHSRFPVVGDDTDDILGIAILRRAVAVPYEKRSSVVVTSGSLMNPAHRVPETASLAPLLVELREGNFQIAIVQDEYGGTSGLLTLEDIVEEIVGEVADEHDGRAVTGVRQLGNDWIVPGLMRPDEFGDLTSVMLPDDGPYETLGGLIMTRLGRIPQSGDSIRVSKVVLTVRKMQGRRVDSIRVSPDLAESDSDEQVAS
ncbi:hemolysin family protein [Actinomycetaceae bacterium TAE3-ERU4]|nr:hemolysin family protein [Actinomycetaceae bacterium TAE3-ERU4]